MKAAPKRQKYLIYATVLLMLLVSVDKFVVAPLAQMIDSQNTQLAQVRQKLSKMRSDMLAREQINKLYSSVKYLIDSSDSTQHEIAEFSKLLNDLYTPVNVQVRSIKILPDIQEKYWRKIAMKIQMHGNIKNVLKFAQSVNKANSAIAIEDLQISSTRETDIVNAEIKITNLKIGNSLKGTDDD